MTEVSGRQLAQQVLDRVESDNAYANLALSELLRQYPQIDQRERAFCTELVYGVVRNLLKLDYILGRLLSRPLKSLKLPIKNILRIALYQLIYLPEIPERAVIHSAVEQVKKSKYTGLAGLVNGVLRNYLRNRGEIIFPDPRKDRLSYLSLEYSTPEWLIRRWVDQFGLDKAEQIVQAGNERAPLTIRINRCRAEISRVCNGLIDLGFQVESGVFLPEALVLKEAPLPIEDTTLFKEGQLIIQDESSMLVAHLVDPKPGETIIDLCAAPGGKSTHLAELMNDHGRVFSNDDHPHKIELIRKNAERLQLRSIHPCLGDARDFQLPDGGWADRVLVDAPCSGTGVLRRRVDAKYRKKPENIRELAVLQRQILERAVQLVKPGGCLVYSTCALEWEEDEAQVEWLLHRYPEYQIEDYRQFLPERIQKFLDDPNQPWVKVLPNSRGGDGFFMCRFKRSE
ncbi:MAG TPA: 16S rRNA (cytosine(967)-C(5))-methyltransferase RsmB [Bacillota bacterium]|nr:16S rRNA (cytosine(967)-C(5))-methyltransferase RsmB [Bacillota bacterium]